MHLVLRIPWDANSLRSILSWSRFILMTLIDPSNHSTSTLMFYCISMRLRTIHIKFFKCRLWNSILDPYLVSKKPNRRLVLYYLKVPCVLKGLLISELILLVSKSLSIFSKFSNGNLRCVYELKLSSRSLFSELAVLSSVQFSLYEYLHCELCYWSVCCVLSLEVGRDCSAYGNRLCPFAVGVELLILPVECRSTFEWSCTSGLLPSMLLFSFECLISRGLILKSIELLLPGLDFSSCS